MTDFQFSTNIEKRSPFTGNVYMVDRMTSEYAERHPFDLDGFIEAVWQEFAGTEFEESREALRKVWTATLSMPIRGDKSVYPNTGGDRRGAAMKVWLMAGDYWRCGLRLGDVLPQLVPACKITRLNDGGWIALFPKDQHLLEEDIATLPKSVLTSQPTQDDGDQTCEADVFNQPTPTASVATEPKTKPTESTKARVARMREERRAKQQQKRKEQLRMEAEARLLRMESEARERREAEQKKWVKAIGLTAALGLALFVIWETGLIIPLGLIGLASSGLLK